MSGERRDEERLAAQRGPLERLHESALHLGGDGDAEGLHDHHAGLAEELLARREVQPGHGIRRTVTKLDLHESSRDNGDSTGLSVPACLLYTSPSPRDGLLSRMPSS